MSVRLPSNRGGFKPTKPGVRKPSAASSQPKLTSTPVSTQSLPSSTRTVSQSSAIIDTVSQDVTISTQAKAISTPSMPPPISQSIAPSSLPPSTSTSSAIPASPLAPTLPISKDPATQKQDASVETSLAPPPPTPREGSTAPSIATSSSIMRSGRTPALIQAFSANPSGVAKGRIPSRHAQAQAETQPQQKAIPAAGPSTSTGPQTEEASAIPLSTPAGHPPASPAQRVPTAPSDLPPTLAPASQTASSDLPPTLGTNQPVTSTSSSRDSPSHSRADVAAMANALVATIANVPGNKAPHFMRRKGTRVAEGRGIRTSKRIFMDRTGTQLKRKGKRGRGDDDEEDEVEEGEDDEGGLSRIRRSQVNSGENAHHELRITRKRGPYRSKGKAGTAEDKRLSKNKKKKTDEELLRVPTRLPEIDGLQPGDQVGDVLEPEMATMGSLATVAVAGKVSQRGLQLREHQKEESAKAKRNQSIRAQEAWKKKQAQRRKLRSARNAVRATRREAYIDGGLDPGNYVSEDEPNSEEEYPVNPDWLRSIDDEEDIRRGKHGGRQNGDQHGPNGEGGGASGLSRGPGGLSLNDNGAEFDVNLEDDDLDAALRNAGYTLDAPPPQTNVEGDHAEDGDENVNERGDDEDEDGVPDWENREGVEYDIGRYQDEVEDRRRENMERSMNQNVVEEDDTVKMVNSATWGKKPHIERWTKEDTDLFFWAVSQVGPVPSMLVNFFRGRTQRQLKNKLNRELSKNPERFKASNDRSRIDTAYITEMTGFDIEQPHPDENGLFELAEKDKRNAKRRDEGLPEEEDVNLSLPGEGGDGDAGEIVGLALPEDVMFDPEQEAGDVGIEMQVA